MVTDNSYTPDKEDEIRNVKDSRSHCVILGAGASVAALPNGDKNGKYLPTMDNLIKTIRLENILTDAGIVHLERNFEEIFSEIYANPDLDDLKLIIEDRVSEYFKQLQLPEQPTIYDHLLLCLRKKDIVATFNWDPFLIQAYRRNSNYTKRLPAFVFLHGNVMTGYCPDHGRRGAIDARCNDCLKFFTPSRLLFPITKKNYNDDIYIKNEWEIIKWALETSFMLTIFGYGAPSTDVEAMELMRKSWSDLRPRTMEQVEIIDIKSEDEILDTWDRFIYSHHYDYFTNFYDSWIPNHPRRTFEAYFNQILGGRWTEINPIPRNTSFKELWQWYDELIKAEEDSGFD